MDVVREGLDSHEILYVSPKERDFCIKILQKKFKVTKVKYMEFFYTK